MRTGSRQKKLKSRDLKSGIPDKSHPKGTSESDVSTGIILGKIQTWLVSQVMENQPKHFSGIQNLLTMVDLSAVRKDCEIVHLICAAVSRRAAYMCAAGISAIAKKIASKSPFRTKRLGNYSVPAAPNRRILAFERRLHETERS